jgi:hypothetical protein
MMTAPATTNWPSPDSGDKLAHLTDSWGGSSTESPRELVAGVLDEMYVDDSSVGVFTTVGKHGFPRSTLGNAHAKGFLNSAITSELSEKSAAKEDEEDFVVDEGCDDQDADADTIKEEVNEVLNAIDYHQGILWPENDQKIIAGIAKARAQAQAEALEQGNGRKGPIISQDLRMILTAATHRGVSLGSWFGHYDPKRTGRVSHDDLRRALAGLGIGISVGSGATNVGGVEYGTNAHTPAHITEDVVERALSPEAITELVERLDDGGMGTPYGLLIKCAKLSPNQFDKLLPRRRKVLSRATPSTRVRAGRSKRPTTPSQAQHQAKARVRAQIRTASSKKKLSTTMGGKGVVFATPKKKEGKAAGRGKGRSAGKSAKEATSHKAPSPVPGEASLNVQVAIQTMQRITNKRIAKREAREKAAMVTLTADEDSFEDRLIKLIQASGPFYALLKDIERKNVAGQSVDRKYLTVPVFEKIIHKLFAVRIREEDSLFILERAASLVGDADAPKDVGVGGTDTENDALLSALSPKDKRAFVDHGEVIVSTKRMARYLRRIRCRKRMGFGDWFGRKMSMSAEKSRSNQVTVQEAAEGKLPALRRVAASASVLEVDALTLLGNSMAPRATGAAVNNELNVPELQAALDELQVTLLAPGTMEGEALAVAREWTESHDGRMKVLVLARDKAGIGPRFGTAQNVTPTKKRGKAVEEYPEPPASTVEAAAETLKTERFAQLMGDDRFKKAIFRKLFGEYTREMMKGHGSGNFMAFQSARAKRQEDVKAAQLGWQKKKAKEEDKRRSADNRFAGVNELIEFVQSVILNSAREITGIQQKYNMLRTIGADRLRKETPPASKHAELSPSSSELAKGLYGTGPAKTPKVGTVSMKEFVEVMRPVFFSLQADPKTSILASVVLDGLGPTIDRSYEALVQSENGAKKLKELGESVLRRMQDQLIRDNRAVQNYQDLFLEEHHEAKSLTILRLNEKEKEAKKKYGEWVKQKKKAAQKKEVLAMKKSKTEGDAARKLKADSLVHVQKWHKDIKTRTKKLNKSKTKSIEPRPAWVDVVIPTFHEDAIKAARKKKKNKGLL